MSSSEVPAGDDNDIDDALSGVLSRVLDESVVPLEPTRLVTRARARHESWQRLSPLECMRALTRLRKRRRVDVGELEGHLYPGARDMKAVVAGCLVSAEYRELGMTVLPLGETCWVPLVPAEAEHRFFEFRQSKICANAGLGLFLRAGRQLRPGTIALEYRGRRVKCTMQKEAKKGSNLLLPYVVNVSGEAAVDGRDHDGLLMSLAPLINDNGPQCANLEMKDFPEYPGRVFLVAIKQIFAGDELLACYGAAYWGYKSYEDIGRAIGRGGASRPVMFHASPGDDVLFVCRGCSSWFPRRVKLLHAVECCDQSEVKRLVDRLDSLPRNAFTALDYASPQWDRPQSRRRCAFFVNAEYALTFFNSHEDVVDDND